MATPNQYECVVAPPQRCPKKTKAIARPGKLCDRLLPFSKDLHYGLYRT
ncbi:hypothetical protein [Nostoc sp. MS1]|nr:hypothetical protein [Nostoc sp. MS1]